MRTKVPSLAAALSWLFLFTAPASAQVEQAWVATYDGASVQPEQTDYDQVMAMAVDKLGRAHVTGVSYGSNGTPNIVTIQYSPTGQPLWVASYDAARDSDYPGALVLDDAGNVYITGTSYGADTGADLIALKYDSSGQLLWASRYNGPGNSSDSGNALRVDPTGNVYVTGYSYNSFGNFDAVTIKYDAQGTELWVARYDGPGRREDRGQDLAVDAGGNVYVAGFTTVECYFEPNGDEVCLSDGITIKYSPNGQELWVDRFDGGARSNDTFNAIVLDSSGRPTVTGAANGQSSFVTVKYLPDGRRLWVARERDDNLIRGGGWKIATDASDNVFVLGLGMQLLKYNPHGRLLWSRASRGVGAALAVDSAGNAALSGTSILDGPGDLADAVVAKYDPCGNLLWNFTYNGGSNYFDTATALALDIDGNVLAGGTTAPNLQTGPDFLTLKLIQRDAPLPPFVSLCATRAATREGWGWLSPPALFTVTREGETNAPLTVRYAISGTASNGVDYVTIADRVVIPAGHRSAAITIRPIDDTRPEPIETVRLELAPDPAYRLCSHRTGVVFIVDNDHPRR